MQHNHVLKKVEFWPIDPITRVEEGGGFYRQNVCYHVAAFVILFYLICNMIMFWKCLISTPSSKVVGLGSAGQLVATKLLHFICCPFPGSGGVCRHNSCYHFAAFVIPFNSICNMSMFWKSWILTPSPRVCEEGSAGKKNATMLLHSWFPFIWYATWHCSEKVEFWPFDPKGQWGCLLAKYLLPCCYISWFHLIRYFVAFTKAFDNVVWEVIWYKLIKIGERDKILNIIMSMYKHDKAKVKINNSISIGFECNLDVSQGECLSPFLFCFVYQWPWRRISSEGKWGYKHRLELFDKLVTPIMNYGSEVWGFCHGKQIEIVISCFVNNFLV